MPSNPKANLAATSTGSVASDAGNGTKKELGLIYKADGQTIPVKHTEPVDTDIWRKFRRYNDESVGSYVKRLCTEGDTVPDAFLTNAASQIGQVMLTCPNALWKSGLISGGLWMLISAMFAMITMWIMNVFYVDYKKHKVQNGSWFKPDRHATQYHDVIMFHAGKWIGIIAQVFVMLQLIGTGVAQIIACSTDWYAVNQHYTKRELQVIWGGVLQIVALFPSFKHFRLLNILALTGTTYTALWLLYEANKQGYDYSAARLWPEPSANGITSASQYFFSGSAVLMGALGSHAISTEMMDAMQTPRQYAVAYTGGWVWTMFLIIPHSIAINLAFPTILGANDNVYQVVPMSKAKLASVSLLIMHQLAAFAYYVTPIFYLWERFNGTHTKAWYIRLPSRLPVSMFIWLLAMLFPFYGAINSLMAAISVPFTAFALPCLLYIWIHRKKEQRDLAIMKPYGWLQGKNWLPMFAICAFFGVIFIGYGFTAIAYSLKSIVDNSRAFGVFARCYQCKAGWEQRLKNPNNPL